MTKSKNTLTKMKQNIIALEGPEFSGKTTVAELLTDKFAKDGLSAKYVRLPGGTPLGEKLRNIIKTEKNSVITNLGLALATHFSCYESMYNDKETQIFVLDRFIDSILVYQGMLDDGLITCPKLTKTIISSLVDYVSDNFNIIKLYLKNDVETLLDRRAKTNRENTNDIYDLLPEDTFKRLAHYYDIAQSPKVFFENEIKYQNYYIECGTLTPMQITDKLYNILKNVKKQ